ncbi:MAG: ATP-dependent Clp protease ATP-binding subunit ClpX [Lachnospiraceae bacterium]|nr:ATP-dependent Clp protease ATP-binding subunit ClpX [Lachnospiraceae bacterium]
MSDNNRDDNYEKVCAACHRTESQAGRMIRMYGGLYVCTDCLQRTFDMMNMGGKPADMGNNPNFGMGFDPFMMNPYMNMDLMNGIPNSQRIKKRSDENGQNGNGSGNNAQNGGNGAQSDNTKGGGNGPANGNSGGNGSNGTENGTGNGNNNAGNNGEAEAPALDFRRLPPPHKIKAQLDEYVIGQERAKKIISVAVYNHYKRVTKDATGDIQIDKSNILMIGPTGCGKTYIVQTLARLLNVPLAITDATTLTEAGYIGDDVESVLSKLLKAADNDVERAESGIVFIDEIDKIAKKKNVTNRDVSGESVQQGLLKILEGAKIDVPVGASSKNALVPMVQMDTRNILFICGGAFPDLEDIIKRRLTKQSGIGFNADLKDKFDKEPNILEHTSNEDLREYGMIPEFLGRLPVICPLHGLDAEMLVKIMRDPRNAILKQYQKLLALDEVDLQFDEGALEAIAQKSLEKQTGARGLRSIIEEFMLDIMYEIPKDSTIGRVFITKDYVEGSGGPRIEVRG